MCHDGGTTYVETTIRALRNDTGLIGYVLVGLSAVSRSCSPQAAASMTPRPMRHAASSPNRRRCSPLRLRIERRPKHREVVCYGGSWSRRKRSDADSLANFTMVSVNA